MDLKTLIAERDKAEQAGKRELVEALNTVARGTLSRSDFNMYVGVAKISTSPPVVKRMVELAKREIDDAYDGVMTGSGARPEMNGIFITLRSLERLDVWNEGKKLIREVLGQDAESLFASFGMIKSVEDTN